MLKKFLNKKRRNLFYLLFIASLPLSALATQVTNDIDPVITLVCDTQSDCTGNIEYKKSGNTYTGNGRKGWTGYKLMGKKGYYGYASLGDDSSSFSKYEKGTDQWIENFSGTCGSGKCVFTGTVHENEGPFPHTSLATPALHSDGSKIVLKTKGDKIVDDKGKVIQLKGIARPSLEWNDQGEKLSVKDLENMKAWGANVIRLSLSQNFWLASKPETTPGSYKQIIDAVIYHAIKNKMAVILDLHWTEQGHQNELANQDSITFWKQVAAKYKDFGTVIFELFNEPGCGAENYMHRCSNRPFYDQHINKAIWKDGGTKVYVGDGQSVTYVGYQQLYDAVRGTGAQNIVIINGLFCAYNLSFVNDNFKVAGTNIVYGAHPYRDQITNDNYDPGYPTQDGTKCCGLGLKYNFNGIKGKYPIIFTEFGSNTGEDYKQDKKFTKLYEKVLKFIDSEGIHYTAYAWFNDPSKSDFDNAYFPVLLGRDWVTPVNGGVLIKQNMKTAKPIE